MRRTSPPHRRAAAGRALLGLAVLLVTLPAAVAAPAARPAGALLPGSSGREPISVDASKLDYFDREQKLVYTGDVVARQGDSVLKGSVLTLFLTKQAKKAGASGGAEEAGPGASSIDRMEIKGPVTVISKDEIGTGDNGSYDKAANKVTLVGNVTLTQATNVIRGDKLVYDMTTGQAQVTSGQTQGRVKSIFTPGSSTNGAIPARKPKPGAKAETPKAP